MSPGYSFFSSSLQTQNEASKIFIYNKIILKKKSVKNETKFPIYLVVSEEKFSFYCAAHHRQVVKAEFYPSYYGTSLIDQFSLETGNTLSLDKWLNKTGPLSIDLLDPNFFLNNDRGANFIDYTMIFQNIIPKPSIDQSQRHGKVIDALILYYKEIVLDFLFDLFHSNVFNGIPAANRLKTAIEGSKLANAILAKADFLYYHALLEQEMINNYEKKDFQKKRVNAAIKWLGLIRTEDAGSIINPLKYREESWFENIEKEHDLLTKIVKNLTKEEHEKSCEWLVGRYRIRGSFERLISTYSFFSKLLIVVLLVETAYYYFYIIDFDFQLTHNQFADNMLFFCFSWILLLPFITLCERVASLILAAINWFVYNIKNAIEIKILSNFSEIDKKEYCKINEESESLIPTFAEIFVTVPYIVQLLMPKALVAGAIVLFSSREYLMDGNPPNYRFISTLLSNPYFSFTVWNLLFLSCYSFIVTKLLPMLQKNSKKDKILTPIISRSFPLLLFLFSFFYIIVLFLGLAPISDPDKYSIKIKALNGFINCEAELALSSVLAMIGATAGILVEFSTSKTIRSAVGME